jgi:hypothetical protein
MSYTNQSYIGEMCDIILKAIRSKIIKIENGNYPEDTTLVVDCSLTTIFLPSEWEELIAMVRSDLPSNDFVRIFRTANSGGYFASM